MMKEGRTIAIIGNTGKFCPALAEKLVQQNLHLLFVSNDEEKNVQFVGQLERKYPSAEIESVHCEKEGCWEADIITFINPGIIDPALVQRIKDVATQKIVLILSENNTEKEGTGENFTGFDELLPHSRVVQVMINENEREVNIYGRDDEARKMVQDFFEKAGYKS